MNKDSLRPGDKIRVLKCDGKVSNAIGVVTFIDAGINLMFDPELCCNFLDSEDRWELIESVGYKTKGGNIMTNVIKRIRDLTLSADDKLLRKYGLVNECGDLSEDGDIALTGILFAANKAELVKLAQQLADEDTASKK